MPRRKSKSPASISTSTSVSASSGIILHRGLTLLQTDDRYLMTELRADPRLKTELGSSLSESAAVVAPEAADDLLRQLRKAGHTPKVSEQ
jgi:hypothetical protein